MTRDLRFEVCREAKVARHEECDRRSTGQDFEKWKKWKFLMLTSQLKIPLVWSDEAERGMMFVNEAIRSHK